MDRFGIDFLTELEGNRYKRESLDKGEWEKRPIISFGKVDHTRENMG